MSEIVRPQEYIGMSFSDQDFRDLVASALDDNVLFTGGYRKKVEVVVDEVTRITDDNREGWHIQFFINVQEEE